jgi:hypothetical protein
VAVPRRRHPRYNRANQETDMTKPDIDPATQQELEAAAFRSLVEHLRGRPDVQNIDLMNLAGFCRNCLSRWVREAAEAKNIPLTDPDAREMIYGMPYKDWQAKHQKPATPESQAAFKNAH